MSILIENNVERPQNDHQMSDSSSTLQENDSKSKSLEDQGEEIENPDSEKESLTKAD